MNQVLLHKRRPAVPAGLSLTCGHYIRACLHQEPEQRPSCKELTEWLDDARTKLDLAVVDNAKEKIKESQADSVRTDTSWWITQRKDTDTNEHWRDGRFTLHTTVDVVTPVPLFTLRVSPATQDDWMENALLGHGTRVCQPLLYTSCGGGREAVAVAGWRTHTVSDHVAEPEPLEPVPSLPELPREPFGLVFKMKNKKGQMVDHWPRVARIDKTAKNAQKAMVS